MYSDKGLVGIIAALALIGLVAACDDTGSSAGRSVSTQATSAVTDAVKPSSATVPSTPTPTPTPTPTTARVTEPPTTTAAVTESTTATTTMPSVEAAELFRPFVADPDVCVSAAARETNISEYSDGLLRPYSLSSAGWHRFQIVADPDLGADGRWALVGTIPANSSFGPENWNAVESEYQHYDTINGWPVATTTSPSGYSAALIDLGGETDAYVRTYRFELDSIRALISGLAVRASDGPIGFVYSPVVELPGLEMVVDRGDDPVDADIATLECVIEGEANLRIGAITGDPLVQYVTVLDQPYPYDIGRIGDAVVSISGFNVEGGPTLSDITQAPDAVWSHLLKQRAPSLGPADTDG